MKHFAAVTALAVLLVFWVCPALPGHGGQYTPPGDNVPPNLGAPSGSPGGPSTGGGTPGPAGPSTGAGSPGVGGPRRSPGPSTGGLARRSRRGSLGKDRWEYWWAINKDAFLNMKNRLDESGVFSSSSGFLSGRGRKENAIFSRRPTRDMIVDRILPSLEKALAADDADILDSAVLSMARITQSQDAPLILSRIEALLDSKHKSVRQSAVLSLGVLGSPVACQTCYDLMVDNRAGRRLTGGGKVPRLVRAFAALSLGLIGSEESVKALRLAVEKEDPGTRKDLIACAITALGLMPDSPSATTTIQFLIKHLNSRRLPPVLKAQIPVALGRLGNSVAIAPILVAFKAKRQDDLVRQSCAIALGRLAPMSDRDVLSLLTKTVAEGSDPLTRHFSMMALARIASRDGESGANSEEHERLAGFFLRQISRPARSSFRSWAALAGAVHAMNRADLQGPLINKLIEIFAESKNPSDKCAMAIALGLLDATAAAPVIFGELRDTNNKAMQGYLCVSLGLMKWSAATEEIRHIVATEIVACLRLQAATALGLMGDGAASGVLVDVLKRSRTQSVASSTAKALGVIGDRNAVAPLAALLGNERANGIVRGFAAVALGIIGEKTDLPWNAAIAGGSNYNATVDALSEVTDIL
jgi:HEAT repeat protein